MGMTILICSTILWRFGDGPLWKRLINQSIDCKNTWWSALLYIQNYYNPEKIVSSNLLFSVFEQIRIEIGVWRSVFRSLVVSVGRYAAVRRLTGLCFSTVQIQSQSRTSDRWCHRIRGWEHGLPIQREWAPPSIRQSAVIGDLSVLPISNDT